MPNGIKLSLFHRLSISKGCNRKTVKLFGIAKYIVGSFVPTYRTTLFPSLGNDAYVQHRFSTGKLRGDFKFIFDPSFMRIAIGQIPNTGLLPVDPNPGTLPGLLLVAETTQPYTPVLGDNIDLKRTVTGKPTDGAGHFFIVGIAL